MPFVKLTKNKAYFKRFQTKYRRRREGKTDYYARKKLVVQAKNKYGAPKYRLVVRITNTDVICQIVYSRIQGDVVLASAYSHELPRYGVKAGLTNYAAAYCTGLLCARRVLSKLKLDRKYVGQLKADGQAFSVDELADGPRPFKAFLDVGLKRTSTGARVFGVMKGAIDGGIFVPHSDSRFPGYNKEDDKLDAALLRKYIYGGHVADYMRQLHEDDVERFQKQFGAMAQAGMTADNLEATYARAHEAIRADPGPSAPADPAKYVSLGKTFKKPRLTLAERREIVARKMADFKETLAQ